MANDVLSPHIDWNTVRERYLTGIALPTLAAEFNLPPHSVRSRAHREGWHIARSHALTAARQEVSEEIRSLLLKSCLNDIQNPVWQTMPWDRDTEAYDRASRGRERLINCASKLLGWDREAQDDAISISGAPVIDVTPKVLPNGEAPVSEQS